MKPLKSINQKLEGEIDPGFAARAGFIARQVFSKKAARILDVGCGRGFYLKLLSNFPFIKKLVGVEIRADYAEKARLLNIGDKRITVIEGSIYKLPFKNSSFDLVICSEVLEHLKDDATGLSELHRVLKPGGRLIVTVPNTNFPMLWDPLNFVLSFFNTHVPKDIWWLAGIWADHERLYTTQEINSLISKGDFKIEKTLEFVRWSWPFSHFILYGIGKNIVERLGGGTMNRFDFAPPGEGTKNLARLMRLPEKLNKSFPISSSVSIAVSAKKIIQ